MRDIQSMRPTDHSPTKNACRRTGYQLLPLCKLEQRVCVTFTATFLTGCVFNHKIRLCGSFYCLVSANANTVETMAL